MTPAKSISTPVAEKAQSEGWRRYQPSQWQHIFDEWRENREFRMAEVIELVDIFMEEEDFDWDNLDDAGNPTQASHLIPRPVRRYYQFFMMWYWDPFLIPWNACPLFLSF